MTWGVTIDFHNTIACCDSWFQLEVYDLAPAFLHWHAGKSSMHVSTEMSSRARARYRELRLGVMDSGLEMDAAECVTAALARIGLEVNPSIVDQGLEEIFLPTVESTTPLPGIIDSVRRLQDWGVPMLVVSSAAYHPFLEWTLQRFDIADCFEDVLTSASCGHYKSSKRIYEIAAQRLDRAPSECIHIGDSERFDVTTAKMAGMRTVLVDWDNTAEGCSTADLRVETLEDLPTRLKSMFGSLTDAI